MMPGKRPKKTLPTATETPIRENLTPAEEQLRRDTNWQLDLNEAGDALFATRSKLRDHLSNGKKS